MPRVAACIALSVCSLAAGCEPGEVLVDGDASAAPDVADVTVSADRPAALDVAVDVIRDAPDVPTTPDVSAAPDVLDVVTRDVPMTTDAPAPPPDMGPAGTDEATIVETMFPMSLGCSARTTATVRVQNTGTTTWTVGAGYALGAVDDSDPFYTSDTRVRWPAGESVAPGATREFTIPLASPRAAGMYTTDWRMVRDGVHWFGATTTQRVAVSCDTTAAADFRLSDVTIVSSPDVRSFPVTSRITSLSFRPGTFHIDHERRGMWPPVQIDPDGTTQEATVWVFFHIGGRWYATGGERLRPNQTDKMLDNPSQIGPGWLYDPGRWGVMTGYVPSPGELVGFMVVAGSTRSDDHVIVRERTGVVLVPFPADDVSTEFPPFAWME